MNIKAIFLGLITGLLFVNGMFAIDLHRNDDNFDINSIVYIEEDTEVELGFDTSDYLPEGFNAYEFYFDVAGLSFMEDEYENDFNTKPYLPIGFDAYAYPTDVQSINYYNVVEDTPVEVGFDTEQYLPENFNAFSKK